MLSEEYPVAFFMASFGTDDSISGSQLHPASFVIKHKCAAPNCAVATYRPEINSINKPLQLTMPCQYTKHATDIFSV